jgi:hypothetical protein
MNPYNNTTHYVAPNKASNYAAYQNFAPSLSKKLKTDPVSRSVVYDIDEALDIGPLYQWYGPQSEASQLYMAEKCSKNWDGSCEFLSMNNDIVKNNLGQISAEFTSPCHDPTTFTVGDMLVDNAAQRRFCELGQCKVLQQNFNPLDPSSPIVNSYQCDGNVIARVPPNPDQDIILNKVLDRPEQHINILLNLYRNCGNRAQYKGTRIGRMFDVIEAYIRLNPQTGNNPLSNRNSW